MAKVRIKHHPKAYRQLLNSDGVTGDLDRRANAIADRANSDGEHTVFVEKGRNRARAAVVTTDFKAMRAESRRANLTRAIDAGR